MSAGHWYKIISLMSSTNRKGNCIVHEYTNFYREKKARWLD